mgnify:CR=1 FL=1
MEEKIGSNRQHKLILQNRGKGNITGICDVVSFDENAVVLDTDMGLLTIEGEGASCKPPDPGKGRGGHRGNHRQHGLQFQ